jgi:hypothetical protein
MISRRKDISMQPRSKSLLGAPEPMFVSEEELVSLACASAQGRRRAVRVQSDANLHKVGCSWSARAGGTRPSCSAGPTTPLRFEHEGLVPPARQTGEPTVSHEGGNETDPSSTFFTRPGLGLRPTIFAFSLECSPASLACASAQGRRRAVRVQSDANLHKVACSWSARPDGDRRERSAGPTTPPRFERSRRSPSGRQTGEATVSHEGGNEADGCSAFSWVTHGA